MHRPNMTMTESTHFRPMLDQDLPAVYRLEKQCQTTPWPRWFFLSALRTGTTGWVLEIDGKIIGFGMVRTKRGRAHIQNMCVLAEYRHRGMGRRIMLQLMTVAKKQHARKAWLEVRTTNRAALILYRKLGFRVTGFHKRYYVTSSGRKSAFVMSRKL